MELGTQILNRFIKLNQLEEDLEDAELLSEDLQINIEDQRNGLLELQSMLRIELERRFPNNNIENTYDMFDQYSFELKITKKPD